MTYGQSVFNISQILGALYFHRCLMSQSHALKPSLEKSLKVNKSLFGALIHHNHMTPTTNSKH
jgi:hypothetical protein